MEHKGVTLVIIVVMCISASTSASYIQSQPEAYNPSTADAYIQPDDFDYREDCHLIKCVSDWEGCGEYDCGYCSENKTCQYF